MLGHPVKVNVLDVLQGSHKIFILKFHDFPRDFSSFFQVFHTYVLAILNNIIAINIYTVHLPGT